MVAETQKQSGSMVTLDVWDTLLRRQCHPDEVKLAAARFLRLHYAHYLLAAARTERALFDQRRQAEVRIGNRTRAEGHDDEYQLEEVWRDTLSAVAIDGAPLDELVREVVRFELAFEQRVSYADPNIANFLRALGANAGLHILSDFYVSLPDLLSLVREKHPQLQFQGGMVSCDQRVNKRTGRLYRRVQRALGIAATQHIHVGDNLQTDIERALEQGIEAKHYTYAPEDKKRERLNRQFGARLKGDFSPYWELLRGAAEEAISTDPRRQDERFHLGAEIAPIFVQFVQFVIERAQEAGARRVYYFTREGEILVKVHRAIAATLPHASLPEAELLEVSRVATFAASLGELSLRELNRFWTMYPRHSMRTLFASLGLGLDAYSTFLAKANLDADEILIEPWREPRFMRLLEDTRFASKVRQALAEKRRDLAAYLAQKGITDELDQVFVVDIGWRGTIQDNLARAFPQRTWHGTYLALFRFLNAQPANATKQAFLFDDNHGDSGERLLSPQAPIEMLFNSASGSVLGYVRGEQGMVALRHKAAGEDRVHEQFTAQLQEGVLAATTAIARCADVRALSAGDLRVFAYRQARALLSNPPAVFARAYFELEHNETFGVGGLVKHEVASPGVLLRKGSLSAAWDALSRQPKDSGWMRGFLTAYPIAEAPITVSRWKQQARDLRRSYKLAGRIGREIWQSSKRRGMVPVLLDVKDTLTRRPPRPGNDAAKLVAMVGETNLQDSERREFNALMAEARASAVGPLVVSWLFPDIGLGSGGHMTLLRFVRHFRALGIVNRIYIQGRSHHKTKTDLRNFVQAHYGPLEGVEVFTTSHDLHESDILIATHWSTAYEVYAWQKTRFKAYFIQDFEPYFYAKSSTGVFAENTYSMNLYGICASPWLHQVTSRDYGMRGCFFYLGYEPKTYYPDPLIHRDPNRVVVYMRPTTERRGTELLLAALLQVQRRRPQTRISIFGTSSIPDVGLKAELMGLQNEEQLRRLHSGSAITLLTSLTNYSLMPIEAMACGSVVVDLDLESMRATFGPNAPIVLARPDPFAMADEIIDLLKERERLAKLSQRSIAFAAQFQWCKAFDTVTTALFAEYFGAAGAMPSLREPRFVRGRGGSLVFHVINGRRRAISCLEELAQLGASIEDVVDIEPRRLLQLPLDEDSEIGGLAAAL